MTEAQAKKRLRQMLQQWTPGSILHLLAEVLHEMARQARRQRDELTTQQAQEAAATLIVVGLGIDAACPR